jgi:hypothetical protein
MYFDTERDVELTAVLEMMAKKEGVMQFPSKKTGHAKVNCQILSSRASFYLIWTY